MPARRFATEGAAESAEIIALRALTWLAGEETLFGDFLATTGASASDVAARAAQPDFLASVLDFLLLEDRWIVAFCEASELPYEAPMRARAGLPGGQIESWT